MQASKPKIKICPLRMGNVCVPSCTGQLTLPGCRWDLLMELDHGLSRKPDLESPSKVHVTPVQGRVALSAALQCQVLWEVTSCFALMQVADTSSVQVQHTL